MLAEALSLYILAQGPVLPPLPVGAATYDPAARATSNWRWQAMANLALALEKALAFATGGEPKRLPRCIRLNNYWCIKRAGWAGEVAADGEGHVAFASAHEGAMVAVRLLRRYYIDYKRTSAMAIVSRWAPAQCGVSAIYAVRRGKSRHRGRANLRGLTTRGIHRTARARFLARHGRGGVAVRPRPSRIVLRDAQMMRAPSISPGLGEKPVAIAALSLSALPPPPKPGARPERAIPRIGCTGEALRIRNYAAKMAAGVATDAKSDLKLFEPDGSPGPNLARVLAQMAAVEIGPYAVDPELIANAIAAVRRADAAATASASQ